MKMIRVRFISSSLASRTNEEFWVKEKNPKFDWYRKSKYWKVVKEREINE